MYYLYAFTTTNNFKNVSDVALVDEFSDFREATEKKRLDEMCFSDDGVFYHISTGQLTKPVSCTYDELIERVSK